jgi:competence ComEA-like helix-hairpin-helix protein
MEESDLMAKVNVNKATRDELVDVAGMRAPVAEAILKAREEAGRFADMGALRAALKDVKGVTANALDQIEDSLEFGAEQMKEAAGKMAEAGKAGAEAALRAADKGAEVTTLMARNGAEAVSRTATAIADMEKEGVSRSTEAAGDLSQLLVSYVSEQMQANVETMQALAQAKSWREAIEVNATFFRGNLERMTQGSSRYFETVTRLMTSMAKAGREEAKQAA